MVVVVEEEAEAVVEVVGNAMTAQVADTITPSSNRSRTERGGVPNGGLPTTRSDTTQVSSNLH